jgi:hypothetical protein
MKEMKQVAETKPAKMTRRSLAIALAAPALAAPGPAANEAANAQAAPAADPLQAAKDRIKTNGDALAKENVPMATEPAFQFKAG